MTGKPVLFSDLERLRSGMVLAPFERVRVIIGAGENRFSFDLECVTCGDLLEWAPAKGWWVCPECGEETTDKEGAELLHACYEGLREIVGSASEKGSSKPQDVTRGIGRWLQTVTGISKR